MLVRKMGMIYRVKRYAALVTLMYRQPMIKVVEFGVNIFHICDIFRPFKALYIRVALL